VFNIHVNRSQSNYSTNNNSNNKQYSASTMKILTPLDNAVIKLETPRPLGNDFKIEQVKVTFLVKDENSNNLQEVVADWAPQSNDTKTD
jgi:hypothetical protein